jgi:hypothetical protein
LEAFRTRGKEDFYGSRDFADVVALVDGREELLGEVAEAPERLRVYLVGRLKELSRRAVFDNGLEGAFPSGPETQARVELVIRPRISAIIAAGSS